MRFLFPLLLAAVEGLWWEEATLHTVDRRPGVTDADLLCFPLPRIGKNASQTESLPEP